MKNVVALFLLSFFNTQNTPCFIFPLRGFVACGTTLDGTSRFFVSAVSFAKFIWFFMLLPRVSREIMILPGRAPVPEVWPLVTPGFGPGTSRGTVCAAVTPASFSHRHGILYILTWVCVLVRGSCHKNSCVRACVRIWCVYVCGVYWL